MALIFLKSCSYVDCLKFSKNCQSGISPVNYSDSDSRVHVCV